MMMTKAKREGQSLRPKEDVKKLLASAAEILSDTDAAQIMANHQNIRHYPAFDSSEIIVVRIHCTFMV